MEGFADLEKIRLDVLHEKIKEGLLEFEADPRKQWTTLCLEKPLLNTLIALVEEKITQKEGEIKYESNGRN